MSKLSGDLWVRLTAQRPNGNELTARLAAPDSTDRLLGAIDADGRRHFLIPLNADQRVLTDAQSRGVLVTTDELLVSGRNASSYLNLVCNEVAGHDAFDLIGGELGDRLATGEEPADLVERVLSRWRRFWGHPLQGVLSREAQLGLLAELWFLAFWLIPKAGPSEGIARWRGPLGSRHDFEWSGRSVEAKGTTSTRGPIHRVNGIEQLAPPADGELLLFSLRMREEGGANNSLPQVVQACRDLASDDATALTTLEDRLAQVGYSPMHEEEYRKLRIRIVGEKLFRVAAGFPRLTPAELPAGVPDGVERVDYEINLAGFERFVVAQEPVEAHL